MVWAGVNTDEEARRLVATDRSGYVPSTLPDGVVVATTKQQVIETLRHATAHRIPVVTRGAGSGLAGGSAAGAGEIVLDVGSMNKILELDPVEQLAVVEPGVLNADVSAAAKPHGLFYAPDPASMTYCSIGGNIATNAGGMRCAKYGVTRESVLGLTAVLADGTVITTGGKTIKRVSGYDLTSLLIGSEGTLAVVVEAILRLRPLAERLATLVAYFSSVDKAAEAASAVVRSGVQPTILELMDGKTLDEVDQHAGTDHGTKGRGFLLIQTDGLGAEAEMAVIEEAVTLFAHSVSVTMDHDEADVLLHARREAIPAVSRRGTVYVGDVGVPRKHLAQMVHAIEDIGHSTGVDIYTIAHAGDGNLHPLLLLGEGDRIDQGPPKDALEQMFWAANTLGGTLTGEHGVGLLKKDWLIPELGEESLALQKQIKSVFDPLGILNPGKAI